MKQGTKSASTASLIMPITQAVQSPAGRPQLLLVKTELQSWLGRKYCDEADLLPLLLAHSIVCRVRTIEVEVQPLGGDSFKVRLNAANPSVGEAKAEIARVQGTEVGRQELYRVAVRADGKAVREDDAEPELLDDVILALEEGAVVAMAVNDGWRTFHEEYVELSEGGTVATEITDNEDYYSHVTTGVELTEGRHYWEVEILSECIDAMYVGVTRPNLDPVGYYIATDGWFISAGSGSLWGNDKEGDAYAGDYDQGDRVGVLLDLNNGSLLFFKNGVQNGPGYAAGSVTGPVVAAVELDLNGNSVRLHANAAFPAGHAQ
jgi:hypothetical protein